MFAQVNNSQTTLNSYSQKHVTYGLAFIVASSLTSCQSLNSVQTGDNNDQHQPPTLAEVQIQNYEQLLKKQAGASDTTVAQKGKATDKQQPAQVKQFKKLTPVITAQPVVNKQQKLTKGDKKQSQLAVDKMVEASNTPAFRKLMQVGIQQLKDNDLTNASASFTKAQRFNPRSPAVYYYLGQVAYKRNRPQQAEAFARRGLNVATSHRRKKALWVVILKSAQMRGDMNTVKEARKSLQ